MITSSVDLEDDLNTTKYYETSIFVCIGEFVLMIGVAIFNLNVLEIIQALINRTHLKVNTQYICTVPCVLVMTAMLFDVSEIPTSVLCRIPQGTFVLSLVSIGEVVSGEMFGKK